jgi:hypothetical protein
MAITGIVRRISDGILYVEYYNNNTVVVICCYYTLYVIMNWEGLEIKASII